MPRASGELAAAAPVAALSHASSFLASPLRCRRVHRPHQGPACSRSSLPARAPAARAHAPTPACLLLAMLLRSAAPHRLLRAPTALLLLVPPLMLLPATAPNPCRCFFLLLPLSLVATATLLPLLC